MNPSVRAILARFNGDHEAAAEYCAEMMTTYTRLYDEYGRYLDALNSNAAAAAVGA